MEKWILPKSLFDDLESTKISFDFGGSALKILLLRPQNVSCENIALEVHMFPVSKMHDAIQLLKGIIDESDNMVIHCTGLTANHMATQITNTLGVQLKMLDELNCISGAIKHMLIHVPRPLMVNDPSEEAQKAVDEVLTTMLPVAMTFEAVSEVVMAMHDRTLKPNFWKEAINKGDYKLPYVDSNPNVFPFMVAMLGSAAAFLKVKDASSPVEYLDTSPRAGKAFLGLGNILANTSNYDELVEMAAVGSGSAVNFGMKDTVKTHSEGLESYNALQNVREEFSLYSWGKLVGKNPDDVKQEDKVRGLLQHICQDLADLTYHIAIRAGVHRVLVIGSFAKHPLVQFELARSFGFRRMYITKYAVQLEFVKMGSHMGALGALLNTS